MLHCHSFGDSEPLALRGLSPRRQASLWDRLSEIECPILVLTGALDDKYTTITKETAARIEGARRVVIPEAGHNAHAERPAAFLDALRRFLADTAE